MDKSKYSAGYVRMSTLDVMESLPEFFADSAILISSVDSNSRPEQKMSDVFYSESNIKFDVSSGYELIPEECVSQFLKAWIASYDLYPREVFDEFFVVDKFKKLKPILNYNHNDHHYWELGDGEKKFWERFVEFGAKRFLGDAGSKIHYVCEPEMEEKLIELEKQFDSEQESS
ncbi:MAG: hypothetical protein SFY67_10285 [Candidatus Melainabacteria bacterium]|nr:hypothetical protein [Candidatus Melainabacteria bacterium]